MATRYMGELRILTLKCATGQCLHRHMDGALNFLLTRPLLMHWYLLVMDHAVVGLWKILESQMKVEGNLRSKSGT